MSRGLDPFADPPYLHQSMKQVCAPRTNRLYPVTYLCAVFMLLATGCEGPEGVSGASADRRDTGDAARWMPVPASARVYPSTRFIRESGRSVLEARFELYDEMGDPVKYAGTFKIELYSVDENLGNTPRRLLYSWNADLLSLDEQREHYDPITRGYLFRLGVDNLKIAKQTTLLKMTFDPVDRPRLEEVEAEVRSNW